MAIPKPAAKPANMPNAPAPAPPQTQVAAQFQTVPSPFKFALRTGVPIPQKARFGAETIYPYAVMEVGQSFFVPATADMPEPWKSLTSLSSRKTREMWPKKFVTVRVTEEGVPGVAVWRAEDNTQPLADPVPRKRKDKSAAEALAQEAQDGDTSNKQPVPDFE